MKPYVHTVQYYETDKMGITHHSNYIRWMEEARVDFLKQEGLDYAGLEEEGIVSPTIEVNCKYKKSTTFPDTIQITVHVRAFNGVKLFLVYEMKTDDQKTVAEAESVHCFLNKEGKPVRMEKEYPALYNKLRSLVEETA